MQEDMTNFRRDSRLVVMAYHGYVQKYGLCLGVMEAMATSKNRASALLQKKYYLASIICPDLSTFYTLLLYTNVEVGGFCLIFYLCQYWPR